MRALFLKVIVWFIILYTFTNLLTASINYLSVNDYETLGINGESYLILLSSLFYTAFITQVVFILIYTKIKMKEIIFFLEKGKELKKIFYSLVLIYLVSFLLDPLYRTSRTIFEYNLSNLDWAMIIDIIAIVIIGPIFEEIFFRDLLLKPFLKNDKQYIGIIFTSLLYSLNHIYIININIPMDYLSSVNYFFIGIILSILMVRYGLYYAILAHSFYNILSYIYTNKIVNLFLLDYIKSDMLYWVIYILIVVFVIFSIYKLVPIGVNRYKSGQ